MPRELKVQSHDNHFPDYVAGCAVCGSMLGASLPETLPAKLDCKRQAKPISPVRKPTDGSASRLVMTTEDIPAAI